MLAINEAKYVGNYCISLVFNNGRKGLANLKETIFVSKIGLTKSALTQRTRNILTLKKKHRNVRVFSILERC